MAGKKGASGRRKTPATIIKEAYDLIDNNMPTLFHKLYDKAINGDREALIYLIDRRLGKPKQQIDAELKGALGLMTASEYRVLLQGVAQRKIELEGKLLEEGDATQQSQG